MKRARLIATVGAAALLTAALIAGYAWWGSRFAPASARAERSSASGGTTEKGPVRVHAELALIVNDEDPFSVETGAYYAKRRGIPARNIVHVRFAHEAVLSPSEFAPVKRRIDALIPAGVEFLALAWTEPYRVGCMSATSAFAFGFDAGNCASGCELTPLNPYFDSDTQRPYEVFHMRPAMMLAASDVAHAKALIDRGIAADDSLPYGTAYLLDTRDKTRDVRAATYVPVALGLLGSLRVNVQIAQADALFNRSDVLFYFTGIARVKGLETLRFLPGAIADHLTSYGGELVDSPQMSSLAWLEAGATGSYGTVVEPCSFAEKFPAVPIVIRRYLAGERLIEAYWKSVARPSQGVFIGEPLAQPFLTPGETSIPAVESAAR